MVVMSKLAKTLLASALVAAAISPTAARADTSQCTGRIRAMGYFIIDVDSDWDRPYDKFSAIKGSREYDIWVDKNTCKVVQTLIDNDRRWPD
jgi:hypothetical protein